jgi:hypothetical protein
MENKTTFKKEEIMEVLSYHNRNGNICHPGFLHILKILSEQGDDVDYNVFMHRCRETVYSSGKLAGETVWKQKFFNGFQQRMRKFKKGKDYKI